MVMHTINPSSGKVEAGRSQQEGGQPGPHSDWD